ncbi:MAG TPA: transferrin receptor-like dimerization domain-containing protein [Gemmatimonadaceae bacterium]|nr:transferrin receptor-like dimerization domain-containing protein [Gemmatimonadaceae bacterium]
MMRSFSSAASLTALGAALLFAAPLLAQQPATQLPIRGFPADALAQEAQLETRFRAIPNADTLRNQLRILSENPHEAGTERSHHVAELILARFKSYGLDAHIEQFQALMPRPISRRLELVGPTHYTAKLKETPVKGDKDSGDANQLPTFNAYSPDGDVTAPLVYVNYGIPADYTVLDSLGISVKGAIVIARYGRSWRGIKSKLAAQHGAVGCIIYSDPRDDGYWANDVYPKGPMRPPQGVQRGSVMDMPTYPGDPLSPGWASEPGARQLTIKEAKTIALIPTLPIGYGDALPLLKAIGGPVAPTAWRGALPITYHVGPGPAKVHLALKFDWKSRPLYDVIARIPGSVWPDQWAIWGNHHDGWVNGADDPLSGQVSLDEAARAMGTLLKTGWRPKRTIIFAAWDGEEWGLLGSTEWAEKHRAELAQKTVAYINSDTNAKGWLGVSGSHSLQTFMEQVARDIRDPKTGKSVLDAVLARRNARRSRAQRPATGGRTARNGSGSAAADTTYRIGALGSGSDYTAFLDFVGVPSLSVAYGGGTQAGVYHSIYDSYDFYTRFYDSTFAYEVAEAQTVGTALLRLADAPVLPFEFTNVASTYRGYAEEIQREARRNPATRSLDLSAVLASIGRLQQAGERYEAALAPVTQMSSAQLSAHAAQLGRVNAILFHTEHALTDSAGLDNRSWFKHLIYAPGFYTGYGVKTMPGIREAVEDVPNGAVAQREAGRVAAAIGRMAAQVDSAATALVYAVGSGV